jgi:uncharacterized protein DUF4377
MSRSLVLLLLVACDGGQSPPETATIGALREACVGAFPQLCLLITQDGEQHREFFGIEGYTHRWGTESEITFHREPIDEPLADGPNESLILLDVTSEQVTVTAPFQLAFPHDGWFSRSTSLDMVGTTVECDADVCDEILAAELAAQPFEVTMELTDNPQTLRAVGSSQ